MDIFQIRGIPIERSSTDVDGPFQRHSPSVVFGQPTYAPATTSTEDPFTQSTTAAAAHTSVTSTSTSSLLHTSATPSTSPSTSSTSSSSTFATSTSTSSSIDPLPTSSIPFQTPLPIPEPQQKSSNNISSGALAASIVAPLVVIIFLLILCFVLIRRNRKRRTNNHGTIDTSHGPPTSFFPVSFPVSSMKKKWGSLGSTTSSTRDMAQAPHGPIMVITSDTNNTYYTGLDTSSHETSAFEAQGEAAGDREEEDPPPPPYKPRPSTTTRPISPVSPMEMEPVAAVESPQRHEETYLQLSGLHNPNSRSAVSITSTLYSDTASVHSARAARRSVGPNIIDPGLGGGGASRRGSEEEKDEGEDGEEEEEEEERRLRR